MTAWAGGPPGPWDVIVVGAGPAGSAVAQRLAGAHRVLMLDRPAPPEPPPHTPRPAAAWRIGESLPGAAGVLLRRQGLFERFAQDGHAERGASVSVWHSPEPVWFDALRDPNGPGWHLDRIRFDALLRQAALDAGATLVLASGRWQVQHAASAWQVHHPATGQTHHASVLVDATGRNAAVCQSLGLKLHADDPLVCVHALLPPAADPDRCTRTCADLNGWWYSVRVPSGHRVLAFHLDADDPALHQLRNARDLLTQARRLPLLAAVLPDSVPPGPTHRRPAGSVWLDPLACARWPGLYAVGDAVLACDPISSQGLFHALACADAAAQAIAQQLLGDGLTTQAYYAQMQVVQTRYLSHLRATYAAPERFRQHWFWQRRRVQG